MSLVPRHHGYKDILSYFSTKGLGALALWQALVGEGYHLLLLYSHLQPSSSDLICFSDPFQETIHWNCFHRPRGHFSIIPSDFPQSKLPKSGSDLSAVTKSECWYDILAFCTRKVQQYLARLQHQNFPGEKC
jgi:hypothetical protein